MPLEVIRAVGVGRLAIGLADVMKKHGQAKRQIRGHFLHGSDSVLANVINVMLGVLLGGHELVKLGQELLSQAKLVHKAQALGVVRDYELVELVADALEANLAERGRERANRLHRGSVYLEIELRRKAQGSHHAKGVLGKALHGISDTADDSRA